MIEQTVTIKNKLGLHARAAAVFSKEAATYSSEIEVCMDQVSVNGKSILELLTLAAAKGSCITIRVSGQDENLAIQALAGLVAEGFGEQE
ncbi:MAG: Phosphocarrier protein HPr [Deltaproteobacteria bacterium ADurb.Bin510]|nr:MAG: Phosphocarrier protein HPr [Deltaproteobacteria bacterium ADurb.Bin510]